MGNTDLNSKMFGFYMVNSFLLGIENFIILPSSWYYVHRLGYSTAFLGMVLAARSIGYVINAPLLGKLADKFVNADIVLFISLIGHVIGNIIYSIPLSGYFPLFGRFIMGLSAAALGTIFGETARKTPGNKLANRLLELSAVYSFGTCLGPLIGGLLQFNIHIFRWEVNPGNSPAFVMIIVWAIFAAALLIFLWSNHKDNASCKYAALVVEDDVESGEFVRPSTNWSTVYCLLYLSFLLASFVAVSEICAPLLATKLFHLRLLTVKMLFANSIAFVFLLYISTYVAKTWFEDRSIYTFTIAIQVICPLTLTIFGVFWEHITFYAAYLLIPCIGFGLAGDVALSFGLSLLAQVTDRNDLSYYQSIGFATFHIGVLLNEIIVGNIFDDAPFSLMVFSCCLIVLWIIGVIWLLVFANKHLASYETS